MIIKNNKTYGIETKITQAPPQVQNDQLIFTNISGETNQLSIQFDNANGGKLHLKNCKYSVDGGTWTSIPSDSNGWSPTNYNYINIPFDTEIIVQWDNIYSTGNTSYFHIFTNTKDCNVTGNLYRGDSNCYAGLFGYNSHLVDASGLKLNAEVLNSYCYKQMFIGCSRLTAAPVLPAIILKDYCYHSMFDSCTSLTTAPALPATTLADQCYRGMFLNCTSLTTAPALPATTLTSYCYYGMFQNCTSLTSAPVLPATTLADQCYRDMFNGCTSLTTASALPATTLAANCYQQMFYGCTSLTTAPALPSTTMTNYCYSGMFYGCTSLTTAPVLSATTLVNNCYSTMFYGCSSLNKVIVYANSKANNSTNYWLTNVSATGDFYNLGTITYPSGDSGIPSGWTEHTSL